jgi:prephenate dehydrogenase
MQWRKITLAGVGLLGGSLGLAIRQRGLAEHVAGYVRRESSVADCEKAGAVDEASCDLHRAVKDADLVILCTPLAQMRQLTEQMLPSLKPGAIVTDVGSVKGSVIEELEPLVTRAGAVFVGSHPMAGAEKMGVAAARADLFENAICVVTPTSRTPRSAVESVMSFWKSLGGRPLSMSADAHDEYAGRSSHLVHVVASELANYILSPVHAKEQALLCANGFRDTTRVASGSPEMWRDIALANRRNLARVLGVFVEDLQEFQLALESGDARTVGEFFTQAKERRDRWCSRPSSPSPE